ncbi:hypothetical protein CISIN_1g044470mg [Citrus sinensis]|uniref:Uncharacterized protein n=1 Tax=Citrus sinensis TaxID=2711 RepID=A0A067GQD2_CITSI|nr:hypothetical protein CISIN_1g044470mg [Citrus sinensis]
MPLMGGWTIFNNTRICHDFKLWKSLRVRMSRQSFYFGLNIIISLCLPDVYSIGKYLPCNASASINSHG